MHRGSAEDLRLAKGINSSKHSKFAGRGMKGHKARTGGGVPVRFEGGQVPITRRLPKYGRVRRSYLIFYAQKAERNIR